MRKEDSEKKDPDTLFRLFLVKHDERIIRELFPMIEGWLYPIVCRLAGDADDAKDILQTAWIKALDNYRSARGKFNNYIFEIARNESFKWVRKKNKQIHIEATAGSGAMEISDCREAELKSEEEETAAIVRRCIHKLPVKYQDVIILHYFGDMTTREIAGFMQKPEGTVKIWLLRGRNKLKKLLEGSL